MTDKIQVAFVDSHVHLNLVRSGSPGRIDWLRKVGCMTVSWAFGRHVSSTDDLKASLLDQQKTVHDLCKAGLPCYYLAGIHPRNIPEDMAPEKIEEVLGVFLDDPACLGIGEIGLEYADPREKEFLIAQLEMAPRIAHRDQVFGVHTPRGDKARVTREVLGVLEGFRAWSDCIVVDHCLPDTIADVLGRGFWAGVTLSPGKASFADLERIVADHPGNVGRILLNTDSGSRFNEDLCGLFRSNAYPGDIRKKLFKENAFRFFGL